MRMTLMTLASICVLAGAIFAQPPRQPAQPVPAPAGNAKLDDVLAKWEREMQALHNLQAQCVRTTKDKTFQQTDVHEGVAKFMKPNLAMLEMQKKGKQGISEKYICTGKFLYEFVPQNKIIRVHELPETKPGQAAEDGFLGFLFGMKAEEAKKRYELKLVEKDKEDPWYYYIDIVPKMPQDKADFARARLVLNKQDMTPRQLWFEQPNGNEITWDIPKIDSQAKMNRNDFTSPNVPTGWKLEQMPRPAGDRTDMPPRVIRNNQ